MNATNNRPNFTDSDRLFNLAWAEHQQGRLSEAKAIYEQVLLKKPFHSESLHLLGIIALEQGNPTSAIDLITKSIESEPGQAAAYASLGKAMHAINCPNDAINCYNLAIGLRPEFAEVHYNKANLLQTLNHLDDAVASYDLAIAHQPQNASAFYNRGQALHKLGRLQDAVQSYDAAIAIKNDHAEAFSGRGLVLLELQFSEKAVNDFNKAVELNSNNHEFYFNRAIALQQFKKNEAALESYDKSIELNADYAPAYLNRGVLLKERGDLYGAISSYKLAIAIDNNYVDAYANLGMALKEIGQFQEAHTNLDRAIKLNKNHAEAITAKSLTLLLEGNFKEGWQLFEWRWKKVKLANTLTFPCPLWLGDANLQNKTILLRSEQGLGDTIQFCRFAKLVKFLGAKVILEAPKALLSLLEQLEYVDELIEQGRAIPFVDYYCPLLSLPLALNTTIDSIPSPGKYLSSDPEKLATWSERLGPQNKLRVGLVWSGNKQHGNDKNRSISLAQLIGHLPTSIEFISLQKEVREEDQKTLSRSNIKSFSEHLNDFTDTAALCDLMDLVVSVDTSVAHLAGALGKPTWILLPHVPDWRWLLNTNLSPWYSAAKLHRQTSLDDWDSLLGEVALDLLELTN